MKKWYLGLDEELPRVLKLLDIDEALPGQLPMRGFSGELAGKIWRARINLPNEPFGKRKGPRLVYFLNKKLELNIKILYIGGHKDPIYETSDLVKLVISRCSAEQLSFMNYETYIETNFNFRNGVVWI